MYETMVDPVAPTTSSTLPRLRICETQYGYIYIYMYVYIYIYHIYIYMYYIYIYALYICIIYICICGTYNILSIMNMKIATHIINYLYIDMRYRISTPFRQCCVYIYIYILYAYMTTLLYLLSSPLPKYHGSQGNIYIYIEYIHIYVPWSEK